MPSCAGGDAKKAKWATAPHHVLQASTQNMCQCLCSVLVPDPVQEQSQQAIYTRVLFWGMAVRFAGEVQTRFCKCSMYPVVSHTFDFSSDNNFGQLGDGTYVPTASISTQLRRIPGFVVNVDNAVAITAAWCHSCVLLSTGQPKCWGCNYNG
jgi:hypothetical protein